MNKKVAGLLLVLDLGFLGAVGYLTWQRYLELQRPAPTVPEPVLAPEIAPSVEPVGVSTETTAVAFSTETVTGTGTESIPPPVSLSTDTLPAPLPSAPPAAVPLVAQQKKTRFTYFSRTAKQVQIAGDFNNWTPQDFRRNDKGGWSISLDIPPGDYSYNYLVDGKTVRDPNQARTDTQGRSLLSLPSPTARPANNP